MINILDFSEDRSAYADQAEDKSLGPISEHEPGDQHDSADMNNSTEGKRNLVLLELLPLSASSLG